MNTPITVQNVLDSAEKYGNDRVLVWDPAVFRDNRKNKKDPKAYDCTWIPYKFKFIDGKETKISLKYWKVISSSSAKLPDSKEDNVKYLNITFRKVTFEEIATGDFTPKKKDSAEEQEIEDNRMKKEVEEIVKCTNDFDTAIEIISASYNRICNEIKEAKSLGFSIRKDKKIKTNDDIHIYSIRQTHREDKESEDPDAEPIKLEFPLTRIKMTLDKYNNVANESWDSGSRSFISRPNVFDARKTAKADKDVIATIKVNNDKSVSLNSENAKLFITYRSVFGGNIEFPEIVCSKFGFSQKNYFGDTYIKRNKSRLTESMFSESDRKNFVGDVNSDSDDEVEMITDKIVDKSLVSKMAGSKIGVNANISDIDDKSDVGSNLESGAEESEED